MKTIYVVRRTFGPATMHETKAAADEHARTRSSGAGPLVGEPEEYVLVTDADLWRDKPDEWTESVKRAFPTRSGSHEQYAAAMQMVGNRHSKGALVALVNWLLVKLRDATAAIPLRPERNRPQDTLTVGAIRRVIADVPDETPVCIEIAEPEDGTDLAQATLREAGIEARCDEKDVLYLWGSHQEDVEDAELAAGAS